MLNSEILAWVVQIAETIQGPIVITGDMNISWRAFDVLRELNADGWADLHELAHSRFGATLDPTCKGATRHTFQFGNPDFSRFLTGMSVSHTADLDSHAVLVGRFDIPSTNPQVWKWMLPRAFDDLDVDTHQVRTAQVPPDVYSHIEHAIAQQDLSLAFGLWSKSAEETLRQASTVNGARPGRKYLGRACKPVPVKRVLAAPRFKQGRPDDFRVKFPAVALQVRQVQKQGSRLQSLERLMRKALQPCGQAIVPETHQVWSTIVASTGFGKSFPHWVVTQAQIPWQDCPSIEQVSKIKMAVMDFANRCSTEVWRQKRLSFNEQVEKSWVAEGGSLPFRLVRDPKKPPVVDMTVQIPVKLAPQRWSQAGKAWIKVLNPQDFPIGCTLLGDRLSVEVLTQSEDFIQVNRLLTRREASSLFRSFVSAEPEVWSSHFLEQWNTFWNRPQVSTESIGEVIQALPQIPPILHQPLCLSDWHRALKSARKRTMRGADGWSVQELSWLSDGFTELLLRLFRAVETLNQWPEQLSTWVLILLRKNDDVCPTWSCIRPITVAGVCYRIWSRVRTAQFMVHAKDIAKPLVSPSLSTRAIWTFLSDLIAQKVAAKASLAGLVLDITKCFNIWDRNLLKALMVRFGFPVQVVDAWLAMLRQLSRTVLVEGAVFGRAGSITGIPEGDPLSVVGMFVFAKAFDHFVQRGPAKVICMTYADNWELVARSANELLRAIPVVEKFLDLCQLLVSPSKCWFWSICAAGRRRLRAAFFLEQKVPVKLQARELGADISYCCRKAARERNKRTTSGLGRMSRLHGLPGSVFRKTRLLLSGIFPHALHAAETSSTPKTVMQRLRSGAARAIGCRPKGASPWLACLLASYRCVDPEFVLAVNRMQLFRQVIKELPALAQFFLDGLHLHSRRPGPSRLLVHALGAIGWSFVGDGIFADVAGRVFHICLTPLKHVQALVLSTWTEKVAAQVRHRKYLTELENVCVPLSQNTRHLLPFEKALVLQQQVGAFFSGEFTKHIEASAAHCVHCGSPDSRVHRLRECPRSASWRTVFPALMRQWEELPEFTTAFGLFPEPDGWREWQAWLDTFSLPHIPRCDSPDVQVLYTDGACLFPRHAVVRVASGAVLKALPDGTFQIVWHGILPGSCQTIFRAELLAVSCALSSARQAVVFTDSLCLFAVSPPGYCCSLRKAFHRCYRPTTRICGLTSSLLSGEWTSRMCGCDGSKGMSTTALLSECVRSTRGSTTGLTLLLSSLCVATSPLFSSTLWKIFVSSSLRPRTCSLSRQGLPFSSRMTGTPQLRVNRSWSGLSAWWVPGLCWSSNMTSTPLFVTRVLQGPSLIGCGRSAGPRLPTLVPWVSFKTLRGLNFFGAMFMIRWRSWPFCTIMSGFGFRMTLLWSSQFHLSRRCSVLGSVLSMLSSRQVSRCLGPGTCPKSGPFARLVRVLTVLDSMGVSSCRRWLCRTFLPNSLFPCACRRCGCLHLISFQQRSTRSRNTRRRAHRSHTRAWLWDECPRV